jgi:RNA polymerase sigma-70 factor (ECF subfamily)
MVVDDSQRQAQIVQRITECQRRLYAYILTLLPTPQAADDVLQETNLVLWAKADQFDPDAPGSSFGAWACKVAWYQSLAYLKKHKRDRLCFNDTLLEKLATASVEQLDEFDDRRLALRLCLGKLGENDRRLIQHRYTDGHSPQEIAKRLSRTSHAVNQALYRIRGALLNCIQRALSQESRA